MATTEYFNEVIHDQGKKESVNLEIGRSSFYEEDSIYITVDGKMIIMNRAMAKRFVDAVVNVGMYHGFIDQ
ncbi:MAG: hypothetical protein IPP69_16695 [Flavobacteriales bacterium]|nr:hypothetical protein [Flavobacteriales bacterium]